MHYQMWNESDTTVSHTFLSAVFLHQKCKLSKGYRKYMRCASNFRQASVDKEALDALF